MTHVDAIKLLSEENEALRKANRILAADLGQYRMWWEVKLKPLLAAAKNVVGDKPGNLPPGSVVERDFETLALAIDAAIEGGPR